MRHEKCSQSLMFGVPPNEFHERIQGIIEEMIEINDQFLDPIALEDEHADQLATAEESP